MITGSSIVVETTVRRYYESESEVVEIDGEESKDVTLAREVESIEDMVWALEAKEHKIISDLWEEVKDSEEFAEFGWYGYPKGDITVKASIAGYNWHDVVGYIAERDDIDNLAGVYLELRGKRRTEESALLKAFLEYIADKGISTDEWAHGKKIDMNYTGK